MTLARGVRLRSARLQPPQLQARSRHQYQFHSIEARTRQAKSFAKENGEDDESGIPEDPIRTQATIETGEQETYEDDAISVVSSVNEGGAWLDKGESSPRRWLQSKGFNNDRPVAHAIVAKADTPRTSFDKQNQHQNRLTLDLIMSLDSDSIPKIKDHFMGCENESMTLPEFIEVFRENVPATRKLSQHDLVTSLVELFKSMDLDGNMDLEFSEFLATIIHLGMSSSASYGIDPVRQYFPGPNVNYSLRPAERYVQYIEQIDKVLVYETTQGQFKICNPAQIKSCKTSDVGRKDILCLEYIQKGFSGRQYELLATANTAAITLWSGAANGNAVAQKTILTRNPQTALKWAPLYDRLYSGSNQGEIHAWDIANNKAIPNVFKGQHSDIVTSFQFIPTMDLIVSGSLDKSVRLWDAISQRETKRFCAHRKGVVSLAYSDEFRFLLSGGLDHEVCVWSPFANHLMFKLLGHSSSIVDCQFVSGTPQIVSLDTDGWLKIWDARNFQCVQTLQTVQNTTSFTTSSDLHRRILVASPTGIVHFDQEGGPYGKLVEMDQISCVLFSSESLTFAASMGTTVKVWNGLNGELMNVYRNLADHEITAMCLDGGERKLIVGDHSGAIRVFNYENGGYMKSLTCHAGEVSTLIYCSEMHAVISCGWDRIVRVHDEAPIEAQEIMYQMSLTPVKHARAHGHDAGDITPPDITGIAMSWSARLIACADVIGRIHLWDMKRGRLESVMEEHRCTINDVIFLGAYPLMASCDDDANLIIWLTRPSKYPGLIAFHIVNSNHDHEPTPIMCLAYDEIRRVLFVGDVNGAVRSLSLAGLIDALGIEEIYGAGDDDDEDALLLLPSTESPMTTMPAASSSYRISIVGNAVIPHVPYTVPILAEFAVGDNVVQSLFYLPESDAIVSTVFSPGKSQMANIWSSSSGEWLAALGASSAAATISGAAEAGAGDKSSWKLYLDIKKRARDRLGYTEKLIQCLEYRKRGDFLDEFAEFYPEEEVDKEKEKAYNKRIEFGNFPEHDRAEAMSRALRGASPEKLLQAAKFDDDDDVVHSPFQEDVLPANQDEAEEWHEQPPNVYIDDDEDDEDDEQRRFIMKQLEGFVDDDPDAAPTTRISPEPIEATEESAEDAAERIAKKTRIQQRRMKRCGSAPALAAKKTSSSSSSNELGKSGSSASLHPQQQARFQFRARMGARKMQRPVSSMSLLSEVPSTLYRSNSSSIPLDLPSIHYRRPKTVSRRRQGSMSFYNDTVKRTLRRARGGRGAGANRLAAKSAAIRLENALEIRHQITINRSTTSNNRRS